MAFRIRKKSKVNVMRVGVKIVSTVIALYASGFLLNIVGNVMENTSSPFYVGLRLIGWSVGNQVTNGTDGWYVNTCQDSVSAVTTTITPNCITAADGSGILAVIGLLAIVWVVFEFIDVSM